MHLVKMQAMALAQHDGCACNARSVRLRQVAGSTTMLAQSGPRLRGSQQDTGFLLVTGHTHNHL